MVDRVTLHNMHQDRDETVRSFGARLCGQAGICKFLIKCPSCDAEVNYTEAIMRDVLTRGIADPEIQLDLLGDKKQDMTLEDVFQFIEAKESGKRSASTLLDTHSVEAASSAYQKAKQVTIKDRNDPCSYCGKKGHGKPNSAPAHVRKTECAAYGHRCGHCNRDNYMESVCRSRNKPKRTSASSNNNENAVFDTLCTVHVSAQ